MSLGTGFVIHHLSTDLSNDDTTVCWHQKSNPISEDHLCLISVHIHTNTFAFQSLLRADQLTHDDRPADTQAFERKVLVISLAVEIKERRVRRACVTMLCLRDLDVRISDSNCLA